MILRALTANDHAQALVLYAELMGDKPLATDPAHFQAVLDLPGTSVIGAELDGVVRAMLTLHLLPNVTWGGRPYALIENVATARSHQR